MIRPHLEYANVIWYPKYKYQSISVERVQRRATKLLMETRHMTYTQRLKYLDLPSLWHRRLRGDMIQVFKIINGIDDINCEKFFEFTDYDVTRNSYKKLYIQYARTESKKCTFSRRSAPVWNTKLSQLTKCCTNVHFFKRLLDNETFFIENKFYFDQY